ncbi:cyclic-di-AMP-binding protein CbpB [Niallia taxi]|uniref:CBS domain-containing protein n=1 Tax=Niallia taxi TaxID=2499688 RepID=A0A437KG60_9BACI|nr:cyclic-di-AMP-binding protein CbpB [Niallia taxi]MCM3214901.1 CBS domain-containing protein [Niallia taxi]MED4037659.1 CBS domain-containing protein [Niallia taxi]MED4053576.1 CBS domain-containing protein [Niallia taxi]MED4119416.1 CBS domain-containing protein [Niallia taxi]RVT67247.1 CBS domain-containing protein [Niallia taxi]
MTSIHNGEFLDITVKELMIPSERVAHVQVGNNLEHALLVLTKSGYSSIPVLDPSYKLHGLLSTPIIMESILGLERIEFEKLDSIKVETIMNTIVPRANTNTALKDMMEMLTDNPFICLEDDEGFFDGILTRRSVLKRLNTFLEI